MTNGEFLASGGAERGARHTRALRVLVVDDDKDAVLSLLLLLRDEGHDARGVYDAAGMWRQIDDFGPDAVLLDITLPDRNGYDVARELRRRFGDERPLLIAVTAWNKGSDRILAELAGFDHHVGKPYAPPALLELLRPLATALRKA